jgi:hypothetical protein
MLITYGVGAGTTGAASTSTKASQSPVTHRSFQGSDRRMSDKEKMKKFTLVRTTVPADSPCPTLAYTTFPLIHIGSL